MNGIALQGGGTRGVMHSAILNQLKPRADFVAGTSVGAIVGGCFACGIDSLPFFTSAAPRIFSAGRWPINRLWGAAKYDPAKLRTELLAVVGNRTLADCKIPFICTAFEMRSGRSVYFQSYGQSSSDGDELIFGPDSGMLLVDAMMASSAAQSYFPGHAWKNYLFWDGGSTGFNAPDMLLLEEMTEHVGSGDQIKMLSLGSGRTPWPWADSDMTDPGIARVLDATIGIAYQGPENAMVWLARRRLGTFHVRIDPVIPAYGIDSAEAEPLRVMQSAALKELAAHPEARAWFGTQI